MPCYRDFLDIIRKFKSCHSDQTEKTAYQADRRFFLVFMRVCGDFEANNISEFI